MARTIIVDAAQAVACPKCNHPFPLTEGISRQTIERYAEDFERGLSERRRKLEAELAAEAKAQFDLQRKAWQPAWLRKLKDDQQAIGAELAVIVTAAMPRDVREPFLREADVWVVR